MGTARRGDAVDVAIVGGGVAGLTVAYDLSRSGHHTLLLEAQPRVGGVILTTHTNGLVIEGGPDAFLAQKPAGFELCHELGLGGHLVPTMPPRTAFVLRGAKLHPLPADTHLGLPLTSDALDGLTMLSAAGRARLATDLSAPRMPAADHDESIGACLTRRFGDEFVSAVAQPLLGGIHAGDVYELSIRALFPDLARLDAAGGSLLGALRQRRGVRDLGGVFRGLDGGMGRLVQTLLDALPAGSVRTGSPVTAMTMGSRFVLSVENGTRVEARAVVLAVPAWQAASLLAGLDDVLSDRCGAIPYVSSAAISLAYRRASVGHPLAGTGLIIPRGEASRLLAVSWVTSKWPRRAPDDVVLLRAFAGGAFDEDLLELDDAALADRAHGDLEGLLGLTAPPIHSKVYRWPKSGPQYAVGHLNRVARIEAAASRWPGLFLTGSAYYGVGIPDTVEAARRTARAVKDMLADDPIQSNGAGF